MIDNNGFSGVVTLNSPDRVLPQWFFPIRKQITLSNFALELEIALIHLSLCKSYCVFTPRVLWPRSFLIFIGDELKNFAANIFLKLVC